MCVFTCIYMQMDFSLTLHSSFEWRFLHEKMSKVGREMRSVKEKINRQFFSLLLVKRCTCRKLKCLIYNENFSSLQWNALVLSEHCIFYEFFRSERLLSFRVNSSILQFQFLSVPTWSLLWVRANMWIIDKL